MAKKVIKKRVQKCSKCRQRGHNSRTCKKAKKS